MVHNHPSHPLDIFCVHFYNKFNSWFTSTLTPPNRTPSPSGHSPLPDFFLFFFTITSIHRSHPTPHFFISTLISILRSHPPCPLPGPPLHFHNNFNSFTSTLTPLPPTGLPIRYFLFSFFTISSILG